MKHEDQRVTLANGRVISQEEHQRMLAKPKRKPLAATRRMKPKAAANLTGYSPALDEILKRGSPEQFRALGRRLKEVSK